jgi:hypothetical protein
MLPHRLFLAHRDQTSTALFVLSLIRVMKLCLFAALEVVSRARGKLWDMVAIVEVTTRAGARAMCHITIETRVVLISSIRAENRKANAIDAVEFVGIQNVDFLDLLCGLLCHGILPFV